MIRCLSVHASYVCAHAGECCRAGWTIPVEDVLVGPLRRIGIDIGPARVAPLLPSGECVFFEAEAGRLCRIHRRGGPALLPSVCRHFPRVVVNDPRGTSVTLSHFCPTAAGLLFAAPRLAIVDAPSLASDGSLEGLNATDVLPPLLATGVLADWDGYSTWEAETVALFDIENLEPERAVEALAAATEAACAWKPGADSLACAVRRAFIRCRPDDLRGGGRWSSFGRAVNVFLAAHAFASWAAYDAVGLRAIPAAVKQALTILTEQVDGRALTKEALVSAIRSTDLRLRHTTGLSHQADN